MARRTTSILAGLALAAGVTIIPAAAPTASAQTACTQGTLYFSLDRDANGLYTIDTATGAATLAGLGNTGVDSSTVGLTESADPDVLWGSTYTDFAVIAADGSGATVIDSNFSAEALGYLASSGVLYGAINGEFFTVDPVTGARVDETLASPEADVEGLAGDAARGVVYGVAGASNSPLYVYDPVGDSWSTVALSLSIGWDSVGLAYDPTADLVWAVNEDGNVYTIDPTTGTTTLVGNTGLEVGGGGAGFVPCAAPPDTTTTTAAPTTTAPPAVAAEQVTPAFTG